MRQVRSQLNQCIQLILNRKNTLMSDSTLYLRYYLQTIYDLGGTNKLIYFLSYEVDGYVSGFHMQGPFLFQLDTVQNLSASPFATFVTVADAVNNFTPTAASTILAGTNADVGGTYYTDYTLSTITPEVTAKFAGLSTVATSGSYNDLTNKPTIPTGTRTTSALTTSIVGTGATGAQVSSTKDASVKATFSTSVTVTLGGSPISRVIAKICSVNSSTEANWVEAGRSGTAQPTTLTITVGGVYTQEGQITFDVPAGYYYKFVNTGSTGTHTEAFVSGQQTIYG